MFLHCGLFRFAIAIVSLSSATSTPLLALDTSIPASPTAAEVAAYRHFPCRLLAAPGADSQAARDALATALNAVHGGDNIAPLQTFLAAHPTSVWAPAVETGVGVLARARGRMSLALTALGDAYDATKAHTSGDGKALGDRAFVEYAGVLAGLGRQSDLNTLLTAEAARALDHDLGERRHRAGVALDLMTNAPETAFRCGALSLWGAKTFSSGEPAPSDIEAATVTASGMTLTEVKALADTVGMPMVMARRTDPTAAIPTPAVAHFGTDHFAAVYFASGGGYRIMDPAFDGLTWMSGADFDAESSGYFLIPGTGVPAGWAAVSAPESDGVVGRSACPHTNATFGMDGGAGGPCAERAGEGPCGDSRGVARFSFQALLAGVLFEDTPIWVESNYGADLALTVYESTAEVSPLHGQRKRDRSHFADGWDCSWVASLSAPIDSGTGAFNPSGAAEVYPRGGGDERYPDYTANPNAPGAPFDPDPLVRIAGEPLGEYATHYGGAKLVAYPDWTFVRELGDGTREVYSNDDLPADAASRHVALTHVIDPQGRVTEIQYDLASSEKGRITKVVGPSGKSHLQFHYGDAGYPNLVKKVSDHFGREAVFTYGAWPGGLPRLDSITDMEGIVSSFTYTLMWGGANITRLTTPRGAWDFDYGFSYINNKEPWEYVEVTHPGGDTERVESLKAANPHLPGSDPAASLPSGGGLGAIYNQDLDQYASYYWDREAMHSLALGADDMNTPNVDESRPHTAAHYEAATAYTWMQSGTVAVDLVAAVKRPGQNRVWYQYPLSAANPNGYRSIANLAGSTPSHVAQVVEDENGAAATAVYAYTYDADGDPLTATDPLGRETEFEYAANGHDLRYAKQKVAGGTYETLAELTYDAADPPRLPRQSIDAAGQATTFTYNSRAQVTAAADAATGAALHYDYEEDTASVHFARLKKVRHVSSLGDETLIEVAYEPAGAHPWPHQVTDRDGYTVTMAYDNLGRVTTVTHPDNSTEGFTYTRASDGAKVLEMTAAKDRLGRWTHYTYSALGELLTATDPAGKATTYTWCRCGDIKTLTDPLGRVTTWNRDVLGRVTSKVYPDGKTYTYTYEPLSGRLAEVLDPLSQRTQYRYCLDGRVAGVAYFDEQYPTPDVTLTYDPHYPRLAAMTDGLGTTNFTYHPVGTNGALGLASEDGGAISGDSDKISYSYDAAGRILSRNIGSGTNDNLVGYAYDALSRLDSLTTPQGVFDYSWAGLGRQVEKVDYPGGTRAEYTYHGAPGEYRLAGIKHIADAGGTPRDISQFDYTEYFADGRLKTQERRFGGGAAQKYAFGYDSSGQLTSAALTDKASGDHLASYAYTYDHAGNILSATRASATGVPRTTGFEPDNRNRLTKRSGPRGLLIAGTTDEPAAVTVNGRAADTDSGNAYSAVVPTYPGTNRISVTARDRSAAGNQSSAAWTVDVPSEQTLVWDAAGNLLGDGTRVFTWDAANRLRSVAIGSDTWTFAYDGFGRRTAEVKNGVIQHIWVWCGMEICERRDAAGVVDRRYYPHGETRVGGADAGEYFYAKDHLGSIREVLDTGGNVVARYDYTPFGERERVAGTFTCDFGFTGHHTHSATGLVLTAFRVYNPGLRMWLSADPLGEGVNHYGNLYAYGPNDPLNGVDLLGGEWQDWILAIPGAQSFFEGEAAENVKNFNAGFSNNWLFGVPDLLGLNDSANPCSEAYRAGNIASTGIGLATGVAGVSKTLARSSASRLYETGSRTIPTSAYRRISHISDPVARGRAYIDSTTKVQRALHRIGGIPSYLKTVGTGFTPAAREGFRDVLAAGYGIGVTGGGVARHIGGCY